MPRYSQGSFDISVTIVTKIRNVKIPDHFNVREKKKETKMLFELVKFWACNITPPNDLFILGVNDLMPVATDDEDTCFDQDSIR